MRNKTRFMSVITGLIVVESNPKLSGTATNIFYMTDFTGEKIHIIHGIKIKLGSLNVVHFFLAICKL